MIDFSVITKATEAMLNTAPALEGWTIERSVLENEDPGRCPWAGIYRKRVGYTPRRMGAGARNWGNEIKLDVVVQASSQVDTAEEQLEQQIKEVLEVLETDRTLRGTVSMVLGYEVEYFIRQDATEDVFYQRAVITVTAEARS